MYFNIFEFSYADTHVFTFKFAIIRAGSLTVRHKLRLRMLSSLFVSYWHEWTRISTALSLQCGLPLQNEKQSLAFNDV